MRLDRATLSALEREYGDSFYLVDLGAFEANYHAFLGAFRRIYPPTNLAYSYKTNYTPQLCRMVKEWGGYAEVVSQMEYELACRLGVEPRRIVVNGPYKAPGDIELALRLGSTVNLDCPYQVGVVGQIARRMPADQLTVGVRVTFAIPSGRPSRFGFDADGDELRGVLKYLRGRADVEVAGLHCHFLTPGRSPEDYRFIASRMLDLTAEHFDKAPPRFINLGGGYFSKMSEELRAQFGIAVPTYGQYAEAIAPCFAARYPDGQAPELVLEPGICLTADVVRFAAKVLDVRTLGPRQLALVSGSVYDIKPTLNSRNLPVKVIPGDQARAQGVHGKIDLVGYTCMEHDVLFAGYEGTLAAGDYVVFDNVGAYSNVLRPPFIRPCSAMLGWDPASNRFEVLKRREVLDDVFRTYAL